MEKEAGLRGVVVASLPLLIYNVTEVRISEYFSECAGISKVYVAGAKKEGQRIVLAEQLRTAKPIPISKRMIVGK